MWRMTEERKAIREKAKLVTEEFDKAMLQETFDAVDVVGIIDCIEFIGTVDKDDESAHAMEKQLWKRVLTELAKGNSMAAEALKTEKIEFSRWFA